MHKSLFTPVIRSVTTVIAVLLAGCAHREEVIPVPVDAAPAFSESGAASLPDKWWTAFGSPALNALVADSLDANFSLAAAWQRLREARAVAERESASFWPNLDAEAEGRRQRPEFQDGDQLLLGLSASYEVDLWGRIRSSVQAEAYRAEASAADYQTALLSLSAETVRTWFRLVVARQQRDLLAGQVDANDKVLELLKNRFVSGQIFRADILRQNQLLESTRSQLLDAESRVAVLENQLAVLLGEPPQTNPELPETGLPELPPLPDAGIPSGLVQRRPDLRSAYNRLMAADRELALAVANRWPRLTLSASLFTEENNSIDLFDEWIRTLAANLVAPLVDGGRRRAEAERAEAFKLQQLYAYGQSALDAFREVEDALIQEQKQSQKLASLEEQARLADASLAQLRRQYINGVSDYLDVLTALIEQQRLQRELLSAKLSLYEFRIALYRALAGSVDHQGPELNPIS